MPPRHEKDFEGLPAAPLPFYPAYCYRSSPTWFVWVKLTCFEVHNILQPGPTHAQTYTSGRNSHPTLFYLNHPIQYVQLTGVVVAIEEYHEHMFLITLDDSSGSTIDVVLRKPRKQQEQDNAVGMKPAASIAGGAATAISEEEAETMALLSTLSNLEMSSSIRVKGTISTFRSSRQLNLLRLTILADTTAELLQNAARTSFYSSVLSKPWVLTQSKQEKLLKLEQGDKANESKNEKKRRERKQKSLEREKRHAIVIVKEFEAEEVERERAAAKAKRDGLRVMERRLEKSAIKGSSSTGRSG